jgi:sulfoxide reductase heme-binding subunit YedZ
MRAARPRSGVGAGRLGVVTREAAHVWALAPLGILIYVILADRLSANPIEDVTRRLGRDALLMLTVSLAVTPLVWLLERIASYRSWDATGARRRLISAVRPLRRTFGLYAFFYASLHLFVFAVIDFGLDPGLLFDAALKKRYAFVGSAAFVILMLLAITSTRGWVRRLGTAWRKLHRLVYLAAGLVVLHNLWAAKALTTGRLAWAALIAGLLLARIPMWVAARRRSAGPTTTAASQPAQSQSGAGLSYDCQNSSADAGRP